MSHQPGFFLLKSPLDSARSEAFQPGKLHVDHFDFLEEEGRATAALFRHFAVFGVIVDLKVLRNSRLSSEKANVCLRNVSDG